MDYSRYSVSRASKAPLLDFILRALSLSGCRILRASDCGHAPFRIAFEDPAGQKCGIIVYAFLANSVVTRNRPGDEHRFQIKYGKKDGAIHEIWQDPYQIYTTLMLGIDLERGVFVGIDPVLHQFTKFFISIEFKRAEVDEIAAKGWHCWERAKRTGDDSPVETVVGGRADHFLSYIRFEQAAYGLDQGHRYLLAENLDQYLRRASAEPVDDESLADIPEEFLRRTEADFGMSAEELLGIIRNTPRLLMPVRGWVAERHLKHLLIATEGVESCLQLEEDGRPDFEVIYMGSPPILIECKNVLRKTLADGTIRVDFQKTRASKNDPCSRFYRPADFQILAACLHPCTEQWDFRFRLTKSMELRTTTCPEHLSNNVKLGEDWFVDSAQALQAAVS